MADSVQRAKVNKMHKDFHISIKAVIVKNHKTLILKRVNRKGNVVFELPGGRIDEGEYIKDAFRRELMEEIGVEKFVLGDVIFAYEREEYPHKDIFLMNLFYKVNIGNAKIVLGPDHIDYLWLSKQEFNTLLKSEKTIGKGIIKALSKV